jgi:hypothetical protein
LLSLSVASTACTLIDVPEAPGMRMSEAPDAAGGSSSSVAELDAGAVLATIAGGAYRTSAAFTHTTRAPYPSSAAQGAWIDEWVSAGAFAEYSKIRPDATGSHAELAPGTTIVRAVVDANGVPTELTLMVKGPAGYNAALGDWWFGVTTPDGTPASDDAGVMTGRLAGCYTCHLPRSGDDYLFGVPADDRP